jgi:hypothetical protein
MCETLLGGTPVVEQHLFEPLAVANESQTIPQQSLPSDSSFTEAFAERTRSTRSSQLARDTTEWTNTGDSFSED